MKKLIIASLLALSCGLQARISVPDSTTVTASDDSTNAIQNAYTWGQDQGGANPVNRRLVVDANGYLKVALSGQGQAITVNGYTALNVSRSVRTISGPTTINVSSVAGVAASSYEFAVGITGTTSVGVMFAETGSATWPCNACFSLLAVNNLEVRVPRRYAGTHMHLSPVSATDISGTAAIGVATEAVR